MTKSTKQLLTITVLSLFGFASQYVTSTAQEVNGQEENYGGRGNYRTTRPPTFINPQTAVQAEFAQFGGRGAVDAPAETPRDTIAIAVWVLTVDEYGAPQNEAVVGKLVEKVGTLPPVVGSIDEVSDLIRKLKSAGLLQKSRELRLLAVDGQQITAQIGTNRPKIIATSVTGQPQSRGRRMMRGGVEPATPAGDATEQTVADEPIVTNSINYEQIGNVIEVTPKINADGTLSVWFNYNASDSEKEPTVTLVEIPGREPLIAEKTVNNQIQTSLRMRSGTAVLVQSDSTLAKEGGSSSAKTNLILVGARVIPELAAPQSGDANLNPKTGLENLDANPAADLAPRLLEGLGN